MAGYQSSSSAFDALGARTPAVSADNALIREMLAAVNIVEILENEYGLVLEESSGGWMECHCPLPGHNERTPSFRVNASTGKYHCFGCNRRGDLIDFVRTVDGAAFPEALTRLAEWSGIDLASNHLSSETARALRDIRQLTRAYLEMHAETKLPGGISEAQFFRMLATRLREHELRTERDPAEIDWVDTIYAEADRIDASGDGDATQKALTMFWQGLGTRLSERRRTFQERTLTNTLRENHIPVGGGVKTEQPLLDLLASIVSQQKVAS